MRREDLEERLDTEVTVTLFDGSEYTGVLRQCGTDYVRDNDNLFLAGRKYYFIEMDYDISCIFRCSHPAQRIYQADAAGDRGFSE